jgi:hypothetical protein
VGALATTELEDMKPRFTLGTVARFLAIGQRMVNRAKKDRCMGCGRKPEPFSLLCARCEAEVVELAKAQHDSKKEQ